MEGGASGFWVEHPEEINAKKNVAIIRLRMVTLLFVFINLLPMTRFALLGRCWIAMATEARGRVNSAVNPVAGQVIAAMGHKSRVAGLVFD